MIYRTRVPLSNAKVIEPERVAFAQEGLHYDFGITYGYAAGETLRMDCFYPKQPQGKLPVILWIHGGGWSSRELTRVYRPERAMAELAKQGYFCASIDYRLAPEHVFPAQLEDCKCAVRYLRAHADTLPIDPEHIGVWGESAGGHLAALMALTGDCPELEGTGGWEGYASSVQAAVLWYAPTDLLALQQAYDPREGGRTILTQLVGRQGDGLEAALRQASPIAYVRGGGAPMLVMHGDRDGIVPPEQSVAFVRACNAAGQAARMIMVHDQGHGFFEGAEYMHAIACFFARHLQQMDREALCRQGEGGHVIWEKPTDWAALHVRYLPDQVYATRSGIALHCDWMIPEHEAHERLPVIVWFHGGGWQAEDLDRRYRPEGLLARLSQQGFALVSADYRLLQQAPYPAPIQDAHCVIRYVRACAEQYGLDAEHIGVMGESAGAATAQLLGVGAYIPEHQSGGGYEGYSSQVQAVCSWYGFSNHIKQMELSGATVNRLIGATYDLDGPGAQRLYAESPIAYADKKLPPFLLLHGSADPLVPVWQSEDFYRELTSYGNQAQLYVAPGQVHGFFTDVKTPEIIINFFSRHLKTRREC